ncbi:ethylene-responsive transcription factor-like protein At4g13040 isoform X2 [Ipomoea triloba]|uniref:ethylene-responsive transcription factor-like protein At4g13040 isoform X2 n=1 Tax=Ipomoea triloba TaxID=35885 RepID=UPI00125DAE7A|nr:ethylene-responsive transcription factor-like protein At4g13040 isoform X2 [Ipomoea triloba]
MQDLQIRILDKEIGFEGRSSFIVPFPKFPENGSMPGNYMQNTKLVGSVFSKPSMDVDQLKEETTALGTSSFSASPPLKEQENAKFPVKRRKRHRRKHFDNQEPCLMRGVYFKNMKWQAAIKVDKKQIHLGTVGSQEEAARLYDRAAFMCGREPNFELSEEEKQELRKFDWDEFLAMTRSAITSKKTRRRSGVGARRKSESSPQNSEEGEQQGNGFSASEDADQDTSV